MKTLFVTLLLALAGFESLAQIPGRPGLPGGNIRRSPLFQPPQQPSARQPGQTIPRYPQAAPGFPGAAPAASPAPAVNIPQSEEVIPPGTIDFQGVDVAQVLDVYAKLVHRTVLRAALPDAKVILKTETPLTKAEAIEALQAVLALNNISVINVGDKFVKAVQSDQAGVQAATLDTTSPTNLPELGSYLTRVVQLQYVKPTIMQQILTPFARLPNAIFPIDDNGILVLRDYTENVKRMLEMIAKIDVSVPAEYISEVIPIRYAKVDDIASALNALGGGGGATVSVGSGVSNSKINGFSSGSGGMGGGMNGMNGMNGTSGGVNGMNGSSGNSSFGGGITRPYGSTTGANGTPSGGASTFAQRLNNIINKASGSGGGQDQIQLFGETKIVPDESSSSLLIFATRQDMAEIKQIISELDVPLSQVLIEAVIMDVSLGNTFNLGVSTAQNPSSLGGSSAVGGGANNGQTFLDLVNTSANAATNAVFGNNLPGGFSYFGNIGPSWDVAVSAAESDNHASIIQRPRIQTSQAQPAQFFVGETVPYVTSTYNYGGAYGNSSSYSQLSVGVELDVTPFINPDGEVAMQIQQEIDDLDGYTAITGVGNVPNTTKRTLNTTITVRDRDTVMLGGFIKTDKSVAKSGVPFLEDIPLLGALFSQRSDAKDREELVVLMRPTVLKTPELAARNTIKEEQRLPGASEAASEDAADERSLEDAQRKREQKKFNATGKYDGFYMTPPDEITNVPPTGTNNPALVLPPVTPAPAVAPAREPSAEASPATPAVPATPVPSAQAQADFTHKINQINASNPSLTEAQKTALNNLLVRYMSNAISDEEYQTERQKILSGQ
jgi:general secretion pathway protein D